MKTITLALILLSALMLLLPTSADIVYNVNYENPPHINGSAVITGTGADRPFSADNTIAATGIGDFDSQVAVASNGGMSFFPSTASSAGLVSISWQYAMLSFSDGLSIESGMFIFSSSGPALITLLWQDDNTIMMQSSLGSTNIGMFALGVHDDYGVLIDFDANQYDFSINGNPLLVGVPIGASQDAQFVTFDNYQISSPTYAIDNFRWEIVPEPSSIMLIAVAGLALAGRRLRRRS
jgi:hypothetical protein